MNFLLLIVTVLVIVVLAQLIRVYELSHELKVDEFDEIPENENRMNGRLMLLGVIVLFAFFIYEFFAYKKFLLPEAASEHGSTIDKMFNTTIIIITTVVFLTHALLGWFAFKYYFRKNRKVVYFSHSNKLELIWTVIPTLVLTGLIFYGLSVWDDVMFPEKKATTHVVEVYGKQFQWIARYPGNDNNLGSSYYKNITATNALGLDTTDNHGWDDILSNELHLPVNKAVTMYFRSQDVIHSAYMPHFRMQMNCVPGMTTQFYFVPTKTTQQMRDESGNNDFDYILLCNKICGAAHYTMKMTVIVESEEEYQKWLKTQNVFYAEKIGTTKSEETANISAGSEKNKSII